MITDQYHGSKVLLHLGNKYGTVQSGQNHFEWVKMPPKVEQPVGPFREAFL